MDFHPHYSLNSRRSRDREGHAERQARGRVRLHAHLDRRPHAAGDASEFQTKLDELKVKGHLLKLEYRDKQGEVVDGIQATYTEAKEKYEAMKNAGESEAEQLGQGFSAAWSAFKEAYHGATEGGGDEAQG